MSGKVSMCLLNPSLVLNKDRPIYRAQKPVVKVEPKPVVKVEPKPVVKAVAPKPVVKAEPKPVVKAAAPKPVVKVEPKPVVKASAPKRVDNSKSTLNKDTKNKMNIAGLRNAKPCGRCGGAR